MVDVYYVSHSVCTCLSISSSFEKEPRPDIVTKTETFLFKEKIDYYKSKKAINSFSLYFYLFLLRFFLFVSSKEDKELDSNKLKSLAKNILLFCKKVRVLYSIKYCRGLEFSSYKIELRN